jgi:hypothetical protein
MPGRPSAAHTGVPTRRQDSLSLDRTGETSGEDLPSLRLFAFYALFLITEAGERACLGVVSQSRGHPLLGVLATSGGSTQTGLPQTGVR